MNGKKVPWKVSERGKEETVAKGRQFSRVVRFCGLGKPDSGLSNYPRLVVPFLRGEKIQPEPAPLLLLSRWPESRGRQERELIVRPSEIVHAEKVRPAGCK